METLNKGDIEILTFGSFIGNHFVRENGKYVFQIEDSEMNRLGAKFDILEVFAIFKDNLLRDKYKIGRRENSSQPEIVPVQEEVGAIAVKISDNLNPKLSATEQAFFIAGFEEAVKYFKLINSTQQTAHLQQQLNTLTSEIKRLQEKYDENGYDCSNEIKLLRIENHIDFTLSFYHKEVTDLQQQLKEAKELLKEIDEFAAYPKYLRVKYNQFLTRNK